MPSNVSGSLNKARALSHKLEVLRRPVGLIGVELHKERSQPCHNDPSLTLISD